MNGREGRLTLRYRPPMPQRIVLAALVLAVAATLAPAGAGAATGDLKVTIAARTCDAYTDIFANRARNNIMESLRDLGPDTPYSDNQAADPVRPEKEDLSPQSRCKPLPNWTFTLGKGYRTRAVSGPWGSLSIVTNPFTTAVTTKTSTPLLNNAGQNTGDTIAGATTITLTQEQANLAARPNSLWIQGGTTTDPVLNVPYPERVRLRRAALRDRRPQRRQRRVDRLPAGLQARLLLRLLRQAPADERHDHRPQGADGGHARRHGEHDVPVQGEHLLQRRRVVRAHRPARRPGIGDLLPRRGPAAVELPRDRARRLDARLDHLHVRERRQPDRRRRGRRRPTSVTLAAGDTVTCTYANRLTPPKAGLSLNKITLGAVGTFTWDVTNAARRRGR